MSPERRIVIRSSLLLGLYVLAAAWAVSLLLRAWPHAGHPGLFLLILILPGIVFRGADLVHLRLKRRPLARRWLWRLLCIPVGVAIGSGVYQQAEAHGEAKFERVFAPLLQEIQANLPSPCPPRARYAQSAERIAYAQDAGFSHYKAQLRHTASRFVLELPARALDVDGATIYFDSEIGRWVKFHNDPHLGKETAFRALVEGMAECTLEAP